MWNSALSKTKGNLDLISVKTGEKRLAPTQSDDLTEPMKKPKKHKMKKNKNKMDRQ